MYTGLEKSMHPAASKVEKVNGRLIKKLGSRHAGLPTHYSSLNGGPLPKGEHNDCVPWLPVEGKELLTESVLHNKAKVNTGQKAN